MEGQGRGGGEVVLGLGRGSAGGGFVHGVLQGPRPQPQPVFLTIAPFHGHLLRTGDLGQTNLQDMTAHAVVTAGDRAFLAVVWAPNDHKGRTQAPEEQEGLQSASRKPRKAVESRGRPACLVRPAGPPGGKARAREGLCLTGRLASRIIPDAYEGFSVPPSARSPKTPLGRLK